MSPLVHRALRTDSVTQPDAAELIGERELHVLGADHSAKNWRSVLDGLKTNVESGS